ncbi:PAS domain-containing protein [Kiloniella sp.]|uniref:PAS domain-containing protein n=1 Tax=Kiloniella sp. TaxID=1938587 RepID=UPI003B01C38C
MENVHEINLMSEDLWDFANNFAEDDFTETDNIMADLGSPKPVIRWNPQLENITNPQFKIALAWWNAARNNRSYPSPQDVDPILLKSILGRIALLDVIENGADFRYRLYGSEIVPKIGKDLTGKLLSEIWTPIRPFFMINYRAILLRKEPLYTIHQPHHSLELSKWERLILPLGIGEEVQRLMVVLIPTLPGYA